MIKIENYEIQDGFNSNINSCLSCSDETKIVEKDSPDEIKHHIDRALKHYDYELLGDRRIEFSLDYDYDIEENLSGKEWISASPCINAETYKMVYDKAPEDISIILENKKPEIIQNVMNCTVKLEIARISNLTIDYGEIKILTEEEIQDAKLAEEKWLIENNKTHNKALHQSAKDAPGEL